MTGPFYILWPRVRALANQWGNTGVRRAAIVWGLVMVSIMVGLTFLSVHLLTKIDQVDRTSSVLTTVQTLREWMGAKPATIGQMLNRTVLMMFMFSLVAMLLLSNVITTLSTFFLSEDLDLVFASPVAYSSVFFSKFSETLIQSSWMVGLMVLPFLWAYGAVCKAPWWFYLVAWIPLVPYLVSVSCVGVIVTLVLARFFPVSQTRNIMRFAAVTLTALLLLLFRLMRPELLTSPEQFRELLGVLDRSWTPQLERLPSGLAAREIIAFAGGPLPATGWDHFLLWGGAVFILASTFLLARSWHLVAWQDNQEAEGRSQTLEAAARATGGPGPLDRWLSWFSLPVRSVLVKDLRVFYRSPVLWMQMMLMLLIMFIYLYNIHLLPLNTLPGVTRVFVDGLACLNIGFVAFVTVALALRFGFPAVSMEGMGFFLVHSSPLGIPAYVRLKFWSNALPLTLISLVLVGASDWLLAVGRWIVLVSLLDTVLLSLVISSLALGFGAHYHDFRSQSFTEIPSGFGGMVFMLASLAAVHWILGLQALPFWFYANDALTVASIPMWHHAVALIFGGASIGSGIWLAWISYAWAVHTLAYMEVE